MYSDVYNEKCQSSGNTLLTSNTPVKCTDAQNNLGMLVCEDLKWNSQVLAAASNAGFYS